MNAYMRARRGLVLSRQATAVAAIAIAVFSCRPTQFLEVEDPDIVNPADVQSPAGANAVRLGALARLNAATSGDESLFLLGGLFADEWVNGDSFIARQEIDQRVITFQNTFLLSADRVLYRTRLSGEQAVDLLERFSASSPAWQRGEMFFVQAYVENLLAENYCSGLAFSTVKDGVETFGQQITTTETFERALKHADDGLALVTGSTTDDVKIRSALRVIKGRILMNLNRPADAALAVAGVLTSFKYDELHATTTTSNQMWSFNNLNRRYSVSTGEGTNGLDFATAKDPRLPTCQGGDAACKAIGVTQTQRDDKSAQPMWVQMIWTALESPVTITSGIEARMIEAEAQLRAGNNAGALATLNAARATVTGLAPLTDAGTDVARVNQLFRERAFWFFGRGYRVGDLRRLIRQYNRPADSVFPVGAWHKGGNYGADVTIPVPQAEENNPNVQAGKTCLDRNA
jgi:hypothetical protein